MVQHRVIDCFVFTAGAQAVDDFLEIMLVCGNAEGLAGQKLLRPMFERVVTVKYLAKYPAELDLYLDYYGVSQRKLVRAIDTTFKAGLLDAAKVHEVEAKYASLKRQYEVTDCDKRGTTRLNFTWTPKNNITMAKEAGPASRG